LFSFFHNLALFCVNENKQLMTEYDEKVEMASVIIPDFLALPKPPAGRESTQMGVEFRLQQTSTFYKSK